MVGKYILSLRREKKKSLDLIIPGTGEYIDGRSGWIDLYNISDLSEKLGVKKSTLYQWIHQRKIPYVKIGGLVKFRPSEIEKWLEEKTVKERNER